jgi:hypothetical protein
MMLITETSTTSEFTIEFHPPIDLTNTERKIAFYSLATSNSKPNITEINNSFEVTKGAEKKLIQIPVGNYRYKAIARHIKAASGAKLLPNEATGKSTIEIPQGVTINFNVDNSIAPVLGFEMKEYKYTGLLQESENMVCISRYNDIFVSCSVATGSWDNGRLANTIYSFYPDVPAGSHVTERARQLLYLPFADSRKEKLDSMTIRICDQDGHLVDFRGELITITLCIK